MKFYIGLDCPAHSQHFERAFISVNRIRGRIKPIPCPEWIMDSGAFSELSRHGRYRHEVKEYAAEINRWIGTGLVAAVTQDYMCEPFMIQKTGLSIEAHQRLTIERYDALVRLVSKVYIMPVIQGYYLADYLNHIDSYGSRLVHNTYIGLGSVCKRNKDPSAVKMIIEKIKAKRPDLRLHGFGIKATALSSEYIRKNLYSADSMAWSYAARRKSRNQHDWKEAKAWLEKITKPREKTRGFFDDFV